MPRADDNFSSRLRRMLVMLPWLLHVGSTSVAEISERFGVSEDDVIRDLSLVMCCGVPPYGADEMITVMIDEDGSVEAWKGPYFNRPMRLTPTEGFAVLAAGRTLLAVPGADSNGPLASALDKLERALGSSGSVAVELEAPPLLATVREAVDARERLAVSYFSAWRDELTERVIDPCVVFSQEGRWYVSAIDSLSGSLRHFRVDRISDADPTGEKFEPPADVRAPDRVLSGADLTEVVMVLPKTARWVIETYDAISVKELKGGRLRVRMAVTGERWLERLLLRVGPGAKVEQPPDLRDVGGNAARRLLARYSG